MFYGMPIHIIRDVALTIRSFYKRINDFIRYRKATRDMNARYPDATADEVTREDVCIICRDEMRPWRQQQDQGGQPARATETNAATFTPVDERLRPKKLPCGHILHFACLRSWLERQQNCPTCRRPVLIPSELGHSQGIHPLNQHTRAPINPEQPQGPGAGHGEVQQPNIAQNVFQLGPFRLAFGARPAGQGVGQHGGIPQPQHNQHAPNAALGDFQRLGNAFGFLRQAPANQQTVANFTQTNLPLQLHQIEQQLMRDINELRVQADQLFLVRALQGELARLRIAQVNPGASINAVLSPATQYRPHIPVAQRAPQFPSPQIFSSSQQAVGSGQQDVPPGVTIPNGWTILPLQRLPSGADLAVPSANPTQDGQLNSQSYIGGDRSQPTTSYPAEANPARGVSDFHSLQGANRPGNGGSSNLEAAFPRGNPSQSSREMARPAPLTPNASVHTVGTHTGHSNSHERVDFASQTSTSDPQDLSVNGQPRTIPLWRSNSNGSGGTRDSGQDDYRTTAGSAGNESPSDRVGQYSTPAENTQAKGKRKTATVEDEVDEMR